MTLQHRRDFLRKLGLSAALLPLLAGTRLGASDVPARPRRVLFLFTPNGIVPPAFWPDEEGADFTLKPILQPLAPFKDRLLVLKGLANAVRGDGDSHMRGMSCLLTGIELFPGNIMGGGGSPAGWASGPSVDQEIARHLQSQPATRTRLGSLELGVAVPNRADPWTRWSYAGPNQPLAPVSSPYLLFDRLYGGNKDGESLASVLDGVRGDLATVARAADPADRATLDRHVTALRQLERDLRDQSKAAALKVPNPPRSGVTLDNDAIPELTRMQVELLISAFTNDMARVATFQFTNSVGNARMRWIGVQEGHHELSHDPDLNTGSVEKLTKINTWLAGEVAHLAKRLRETPDPSGHGNLLDTTTIVWTNELGKGNSHTLEDIPFVLVGGGLGFRMGRSLRHKRTPHNRLLLSIAQAFGRTAPTFGNPRLCVDGPLNLG
jgi:hypothetical protein